MQKGNVTLLELNVPILRAGVNRVKLGLMALRMFLLVKILMNFAETNFMDI